MNIVFTKTVGYILLALIFLGFSLFMDYIAYQEFEESKGFGDVARDVLCGLLLLGISCELFNRRNKSI